jgi:hypothetical protein
MKKKELLEMIRRLEKRVDELEKRPYITYPQPEIFIPTVFGPIDVCTDGGYHDYHSPWWGVTPPPCKKCGKQAPSTTITCSTSSSRLQDLEDQEKIPLPESDYPF